jgi:hypothetical protein
MNADGTLPVNRWKRMWTALYEAGDISRSWSPNRFCAIRNMLTSFGLVDWQDESYVVGAEGKKGRATKWKLSDKLIRMVEKKEDTLVYNKSGVSSCGEGREENILVYYTVNTVLSDPVNGRDSLPDLVQDKDDIIVPVQVLAFDAKYRLADPETIVPCYRLAG